MYSGLKVTEILKVTHTEDGC